MPEPPSLLTSELASFVAPFEERIKAAWDPASNSDIPKWQSAFQALPDVKPSRLDLTAPTLCVGTSEDISPDQEALFREKLMVFHPWRKGPFDLFGIQIDTEWRSDLKWERLEGEMDSLKGKRVLDIGCGSGYHGWRMLGEGAKCVLGIEPALVYVMQFHVMQKYIGDERFSVLPLGIQDLPQLAFFDQVFSMGLLYHRRDPAEHLRHVKSLLLPGGELVLETLIVEGERGEVFQPKVRYAQMRNVWGIPSQGTAEDWLAQAGFENVRCIDVTRTTAEEQRRTDWMRFNSLQDFLDPEDSHRTVEGYPAPIRAIFLAQKPSL